MGNVTFIPLAAARLGDYVQSNKGYVGRVYAIDNGPTEDRYWQDQNHITDSERNEHWYSVLVYPAGAVTGPVSRFTKIAPIPDFHKQRDSAEYFADCVTKDTEYKDMNELLKENRV
jgi:hypothetical protein